VESAYLSNITWKIDGRALEFSGNKAAGTFLNQSEQKHSNLNCVNI